MASNVFQASWYCYTQRQNNVCIRAWVSCASVCAQSGYQRTYTRPNGRVLRTKTKSATHLLSIEGGKRDLFDRYVAASTPTHPLFKCVSALLWTPPGKQAHAHSLREEPQARTEEQKRREGPKSRQHPSERYQSSHHTLEHGSNTHAGAQHFTHANRAQRNAHLADDRAKTRDARLRCRDLMKLVQAFGPRRIRQREKVPWAFSRLKYTPAQVAVMRCHDVCGRS